MKKQLGHFEFGDVAFPVRHIVTIQPFAKKRKARGAKSNMIEIPRPFMGKMFFAFNQVDAGLAISVQPETAAGKIRGKALFTAQLLNIEIPYLMQQVYCRRDIEMNKFNITCCALRACAKAPGPGSVISFWRA